jgi:hypothetical protein
MATQGHLEAVGLVIAALMAHHPWVVAAPIMVQVVVAVAVEQGSPALVL